MNIWFFSAHDQPKGRSSRTYDFAKQLVKNGHQVTMFTNSYCHWSHQDFLKPHEKFRISNVDGIRVVWLKTIAYKGNGWQRGANMLSNVFRSIKVAKSLKDSPDVVLGPSVPPGTGWAASYIAKIKRAAFVFEVRDVWPIRLVYDGNMTKKSPIYFLFRVMEKYLYRKANCISTALPYISDHVRNSGSDPNKVTWLPNGIDVSLFRDAEKYDGGTQGRLTVMYVGGMGPKHGISAILQAAYVLQAKGNTSFNFVLVGKGESRKKYQQEAAEYQLDNVSFRDAIPKADIPKVQLEADILVASVLDSEAYIFGINFNKLFDYFASSRPVVLSCNSPNDPVMDAGAGFTVAPESPKALADALEQIEEMSPNERKQMGRRGRRYVEEEYDIRKITCRMETLFLDAIANKEAKNAA